MDVIENLLADYYEFGEKHPITGGKYLWNNGLYSHHGSFTLTKRSFYGNYIKDIFYGCVKELMLT